MRTLHCIVFATLFAAGCPRHDAGTAATAPVTIDSYSATQQSRTDLTLDDFRTLRTEMTLQQVYDRVGSPRRDIGSGIYILEYELASGEKVWVGSSGKSVLYVRYREHNLPLAGK